jgi:hypothetical protein
MLYQYRRELNPGDVRPPYPTALAVQSEDSVLIDCTRTSITARQHASIHVYKRTSMIVCPRSSRGSLR